MRRYSAFGLISTVAVLLVLPATVFLLQQKQSSETRASQATSIAMSPPALQSSVQKQFNLDIWINPGAGSSGNTIAVITLQVIFDTAYLQLADKTHCITLTSTLDTILTQPLCQDGNVYVKISANDINKFIKTSMKVATIEFVALQPGTTQVKLGTLTSASDVQNVAQNIISTTTPTTVTITQ